MNCYFIYDLSCENEGIYAKVVCRAWTNISFGVIDYIFGIKYLRNNSEQFPQHFMHPSIYSPSMEKAAKKYHENIVNTEFFPWELTWMMYRGTSWWSIVCGFVAEYITQSYLTLQLS